MERFITWLARLQLAIGTLALVIFVAATLLQVLARYMNISVLWTEEVAVNAFIWAIFSGAAVMVREKKHFSFNALAMKLSGRARLALVLFEQSVMLVFCVLCTFYSVEITDTFWHSKWVTLPSLQQGYVWLVLPITFATSSLYLLEGMLKEIRVCIKREKPAWS
ncbi:TRAP transporter small permease [Zobellella sp. An-6]|uniref:TRAP transporter small permease n=1 Tax=Zobellella sp. An-6 TaxID=3400218 RepID=UPI004043662B